MNTTQPVKEPSQKPSGQYKSYHHNQPIQHQPPSLSFISRASALEAGKINATTTHIELEQQPNCVSALLTMSCRGRAEAFARSLQSRLRTLGSQDDDQDVDTVDSSDSTWINNNSNNTNSATITDLQPRLSNSNSNNNATTITTETADSYFDFDMEPESPASPIDECEYTRLIETTGSTPSEQQAPESGFVCASPSSTLGGESRGSASSSETQFFDPESSDTGTEFFDCPPDRKPPRRYQHLSHNRVAIRPPSPITTASVQSSSESSATPTSKLNGHVRLLESGDSSDSLPPSQSTNSSNTSKLNSKSNSNSTLQDAEGAMSADDVAAVEVKAEESNETDDDIDKYTAHQYNVSKTKFIRYNEADDDEVEDEKAESMENQTQSLQKEDEEEKVLFNQAVVLDEIIAASIDQVEQVMEEISDVASEPERIEHKTLAEEEEEEESRPQRVRRCSSLKTGKTPPGTPGRKKFVRFADVLGLDLADVRTFLDEVPRVPKSAFEDLEVGGNATVDLRPPVEKVLIPMFQQPGCLPGFIDRVRDKQVCLESAAVTDPVSLTITGCVRVRNLDFHKSVYVRYTFDNWRSYADLSATYVENSCDGFSDKFSFVLFGLALQLGQRVEMAVRFHAKGEQYWDNNYGTNYCFQCLPCSARSSTTFAPPPPSRDDSSRDDEIKTIIDAMYW
ncbi:CLUMA_CG003633, isoform B [Clunio marinus]|uniref:CLUMA_CG003633, isoform B n=1 Tax=Clunio marinus TaxID=568069 RepID=A0A1J1HPC4_9DIPT|nr:CLUMA_CG003633, isoform B [Clunio marinus]